MSAWSRPRLDRKGRACAAVALLALLGTGCGSGSGAAQDMGLIAFHREGEADTSDVYVVDADGHERRLTRSGQDGGPVWSPDGARLAFTSARDGNPEIYVMRADGTEQRRLTRSAEPDFSPAWSPDGSQIMFTRGSCDDDACDLYVMEADGGSVERLTRDGESADGSWSPDGKHVVFWSGRNYGSGIYVMEADGGNVRGLTGNLDTAWAPDWSPDGTTIVFASTGEGTASDDEVPGIFRVNVEGGEARRIASATRYWVDEPEWSPDGYSIAFFSDGSGPGAIWTMNADGTGQEAVTHRGDSHAPSWQPVSRR